MVFVKIKNESFNENFWTFKGKEEFIDEWFLMSSPVPILCITMIYLLFVLKIGPEYMKKRPPFNLNTILVLYNGVQVIFSFYLFTLGIRIIGPKGLIHTECSLQKQYSREIATSMYLYVLAKVSELLDTVFFVLRKKNNQISFLHVYHHIVMMLIPWLFVKYNPVISATFLGTINSFVHVIMYSYYALSTFPSISKYLWWKKYITTMQLVQFVLVMLHALYNFATSECPPPYTLMATILINGSAFIMLFGNFYVQTYLKMQKNKRAVEKVTNLNENAQSRRRRAMSIRG